MARAGLASAIVVLLGALGGLVVIVMYPLRDTDGSSAKEAAPTTASTDLASVASDVTPFTNVAPHALKNGSDLWADQVWNFRPGVVVFDFDRDGDLDFYVTAGEGHSNFLYRNEGDSTFVNVAEAAGVAAVHSHNSGAVACDLNNDGYQDLYVGARGVAGSRVDYRSAHGDDDLARQFRAAIKDRLFVNNRDGYVDLIASNSSGPVMVDRFETDMLRGPIFLWLNGGGDNHWITLLPTGAKTTPETSGAPCSPVAAIRCTPGATGTTSSRRPQRARRSGEPS